MSSSRPDLKFVDKGEERLYYRKFMDLPSKDEKTIRFIDHNNKDYFTAIDEDADIIADNIYKTQSVVKYNNGAKNRYVTISPQVFTNNVLKFCLIENQFKVEVYNSKNFELICIATPGNLESISNEYGVNLEGMFRDFSSPIVAGIKYLQQASQKKVGVCVLDLLANTIQVSEFEDNDFFSNLESLIIQLGIKEVILPSAYDPQDENKEHVKLFQVLDKIGNVIVTSVQTSLFNNKDIERDLEKFLKTANDSQETDLILASKGIDSINYALSLACCNALFHYLEIFSQDSATFSIEKYSLSSFMKLDLSSMSALNIFPTQAALQSFVKPSGVTCVFELLNKCKTLLGSKLLSQWLKQPLTNMSEIRDRQDLVEYLIEDTNIRTFLSQDWLPQVPDIKRILKKINNGIKKSIGNENKKLEDVIRLYQLTLILPEVIRVLENAVENESDSTRLIKRYWLDDMNESFEKLTKFQEMVQTTIDLTPLTSSSAHELLHAEFNIKPEFDESLIEINESLQSTLNKIKDIHIETSEDLNIDREKKLKLEKHQIHGWCFRVTRNDSFVLRNTGDAYIELQTVKAGVFFTTQELKHLSNKYQEYSDTYNLKQRDLIKEILSITLTYQPIFITLAATIAHLDILNAFANVAILAPTTYAKPILYPLSENTSSPEYASRTIKLESARHPLLEVQDDISFIANDVRLSTSEREGEGNFGIITGPNMGGKSTYIRMIGVIALLAQIGSFVPASDAEAPEIPIFDAILSRVGAGDSQVKGLSTFMLEMLETSSILATASHNSLIIIDELGRGTSTYDGFGLAWAILENLIKDKQCFTIFATHFHELTELATKYKKNVVNLHVTAHVEKRDNNGDDDITLMYKVERGISDTSFGIHVAELVRFPEKIIRMAKRKAEELQNPSLEKQSTVVSKRTKCSDAEIEAGLLTLKTILKEWKSRCCEDGQCKPKFDSEMSINVLKNLLESEFKDKLEKDKYIKEILEVL